jgi:hypothetical protein
MQKPLTVFGAFVCIFAMLSPLAPAQKEQPSSSLAFASSDQHLVQGFDWAKKQAMAYAFSGDPVGLWYEAALPGREAFCMRDVSHQSMGAQALGLADFTHNMLRAFAKNISASKDWCSYWEIDRYNSPSPADYQSDAVFWYNLPANFDVLDTCYRMYLWTGDMSYLQDPAFLNFYDRTMNDYIKRWNLSPSDVMTRQRWLLPLTERSRLDQRGSSKFHRGIPGYNEGNHTYVVGIDLLATEYAAYRDYAAIQQMRGNTAAAQEASALAATIKNLINSTWWDATSNHFYSLLDQQHHLTGHDAASVLYRDAAEDGLKTQSALNDLLAAVQHHSPCGVEGESHYAEILYRYGEPAAAYSVLLDLTAPGKCRQEYPEVSYSVIGAITSGTMGVNIIPTREKKVETLPALTRQTDWAEIRNLPIGRNSVTVRHNGLHETVFTNREGPALVWQASFPGTYTQLLVNGQPTKAHNERRFLSPVTWVQAPVGAGDTVRVGTPTE